MTLSPSHPVWLDGRTAETVDKLIDKTPSKNKTYWQVWGIGLPCAYLRLTYFPVCGRGFVCFRLRSNHTYNDLWFVICLTLSAVLLSVAFVCFSCNSKYPTVLMNVFVNTMSACYLASCIIDRPLLGFTSSFTFVFVF